MVISQASHLQRHFLGRNLQPNISEDFREEAVDSGGRGWSAPRRGTGWRGCTGASLRFSTRHTTTSTDRSELQVRLRALSVPSDRNHSPRGRPRGCYLGGSGSGEAVEVLGRSEGIRKDTRGRSERLTIPDPRGPWTHHLHPRGRCGGGGGHGWGGSGSTCGGFVRVSCTQSEDEIPFDVLDHRLWPPHK